MRYPVILNLSNRFTPFFQIRLPRACPMIQVNDTLGIMAYETPVPIGYAFGLEGTWSYKANQNQYPARGDIRRFDQLKFPYNFAAAMVLDKG